MMLPRKLSFFFLLVVPALAPPAALAQQSCLTGVSVPSTPDSDFTDNGDGTVTHSKTGLMWKQCVEGLSGAGCATGSASQLDWPGALQAAASGTFAGHSDWRLPNIKELRSIVEHSCSSPSINTTFFPNDPGGSNSAINTWSGTSYGGAGLNAWFVFFLDGSPFNGPKSLPAYVRLVRGGQPFDAFDQLALPNAFSFTSQSNVATSSTVTSNAITLAGLSTAIGIQVSNGSYDINNSGTFTSAAGTVSNGDVIRLRHTASASASTTVTTTVVIGGLSRTFASTTAAPPDTTPPTLSAVGVSGTTTSSTTLSATSDETATGYWVVLLDTDPAPAAAQVKLGQDSTSAAAPFFGNAAMVATVAQTFSITGLTAATAYNLYFVATDTATNDTTVQTVSFTTSAVATAPDAPTAVSASAGDSQATVSFTAPLNDGGSAILGYTVVSDPVGGVDSQANTTGTTHTVTGLTNGTTYTFTVIASNSIGDSVASAASAAVTPAVPVTPPTPTPTPTPTQVNVNGSGAVTLDGALPVRLDSGAAGAVLTVNTAAPLTFNVNGADVTVQASSGSVVRVVQTTVNGQPVLALEVTQGSISLTASQAGQVLLMSGAGAVQAAGPGATVLVGPNQIAVVSGSVTLPNNAFAAGAITTLYAGEVAQLNTAGKISRIRLGSADGKGGLVGDPLHLSDKPSSLTVGIAVPRLSGALGRLPGGLEAALASVLGGSGRQNAAGSFNLAGSPAFNLLPLGDIVIDGSLADGIKLSPDGLARIVKDSVAVTLAPAPRDLYQFAADLAQAVPGATLSVGAGGVLIAHLPPDLRYVVRPAQLVEAAGGPAGFSSGQDGVLRYDDGQGGQQALNPAFLDYTATRALLDGVIPDAQATVEADGRISLTLGNSRFRLTPDPLLPPLDSSSALHLLNGEKWWLGADGKVYLNVGGAVQGVEVR